MANTNYFLINDTGLAVSLTCNTSGLSDTLSASLSATCTLRQKYSDIIASFLTITGGLANNNLGIFGIDYLKTRCYDEDDAANKTIYDCLAGLRYHFSDIREKPDQDNPFTTTSNYYYLQSMADISSDPETYLTSTAATAWEDFLNDLEADANFTKDEIATLIGASVPFVLYDGFCTKKKYFDKYMADAGVSWPIKAGMAQMSLITNSYLLSKSDAAAILTNYAAFDPDNNNLLLKLFLTLGTSLQGKSWMEDWASNHDKSDINAIITGLDAEDSLEDDGVDLLEDFIWESL
jgi:hypothetical protein